MTNAELGDLIRVGDGAMVIVTAAYRGERGGCLAGFHTQCSIDPPRVAVWISKANHTLRVALQSSHLGVHYLEPRDSDLARRFGELSGDDVDKFDGCEVEEGPGGVPLLTGCRNRLFGPRVSFSDDGCDHVCFVVQADHAQLAPGAAPLRLSAVEDLTPGHAAEERAERT